MSAKRQADAAEVSPIMDFRAQDDAWYSVRLRLKGDKLLVMYCDFPQESDEIYSVEGFPNIESVEEFRKRFRPSSSQLQDTNCDAVVKGMMVCAANRLAVDDLRYFDAIVESVNPSIHALQEGDCRCKFQLLWQYGPLKGKKTILGIEHVCLIKFQETVVNLTLQKFLDIVKEKLKAEDTQNSKPETRYDLSPITNSASTSQIPSSSTLHKSKKPQLDSSRSMLHIRASKQEEISILTARGRSSSESMSENLEQDFDMGGQSLGKYQKIKKKITYFCRIDNLEKDLSPFTLKHFVQEHLGIPCFAIICPSISHEFCTRGFILLEEKHQADMLMDFLLNIEYIIVSLKGRPWIVDYACFGIAEGVMTTYEAKPSNAEEQLADQIKLVHKGTPEYEKVKELRLLHSEFLDHIHFRLLPRLLADEKKLMEQLAEK
ncbi:uncharacterized protein LOC110095949 [Dendrobium catenatum]|uniref:SAWADEE domain-containing protein n=1 Tax=Dendrobium catenatum TaxID=906689 RepID=A0A2I0VJ77_9ASPA|nr:uncharacterized protein LOC110095949 [Dendrobium catenatum]PKU63455.1 hypothetical protein MA16_Dca022627 [Dendrobium catenatum]